MNGSDLSPAAVAVHQPVVEDRDPPTRRKMFFFDRVKVLVLLAVFLGLHDLASENRHSVDELGRGASRPAARQVVGVDPCRARGRPPDPQHHLRTLEGMAPVLAEEGLRRLGADDEPNESVHPVPRVASRQASDVPRGGWHDLLVDVGAQPASGDCRGAGKDLPQHLHQSGTWTAGRPHDRAQHTRRSGVHRVLLRHLLHRRCRDVQAW